MASLREKLSQLDNLFPQKKDLTTFHNQQLNNSVISSAKIGVYFVTLNTYNYNQSLIFNSKFGYLCSSIPNNIHMKQLQLLSMMKFTKTLRRLLIIVQLTKIFRE